VSLHATAAILGALALSACSDERPASTARPEPAPSSPLTAYPFRLAKEGLVLVGLVAQLGLALGSTVSVRASGLRLSPVAASAGPAP
jgi:hypothetical protein